MKGYKSPEAFENGKCFLCGQPTKEDNCVHLECALARAEEKNKRRKKAKEEIKE